MTAVREDITANLQAEAEEEMEMKLVPAKISKAMKVAEASKANATQMAEKAEKKASEAEQELQKANKMKDELEMGAKKLEEIKEDAQKKMESGKEAQAAWKKEKDALTALEKEYEAEDKKYGELAKKVEEEIKRLIQEKTQGNLKLAEMRKKKNLKGEEVEKLATETAAAGSIARSAQEAAEKADAKFKEAEKKCEAQKSLAEKAATVATTAQAEYGQAKDEASNAEMEVQNRMAEKQQVLELRNSVQSYYDSTDLMTKSMEASLAKLTGGEEESTKKPWDLMREDENVKKSMVSYNLMVGQFRRTSTLWWPRAPGKSTRTPKQHGCCNATLKRNWRKNGRRAAASRNSTNTAVLVFGSIWELRGRTSQPMVRLCRPAKLPLRSPSQPSLSRPSRRRRSPRRCRKPCRKPRKR